MKSLRVVCALSASVLAVSASMSSAGTVTWRFDLSDVPEERKSDIRPRVFFEEQVGWDATLTFSLATGPGAVPLSTVTRDIQTDGRFVNAGLDDLSYRTVFQGRENIWAIATVDGNGADVNNVSLGYFDPFPNQVLVPGQEFVQIGDGGGAAAPTISVPDQNFSFSIPTKEELSFSSTFEYDFSGPTLDAAFIVRDDTTLEQAAASEGFESFNWLQIVNSYPANPITNCLSTARSGPFFDPRPGGCVNPPISADDLPFYYDAEEEFEGEQFHIDTRERITGLQDDNGILSIVDVGITFSDSPNAALASALTPMEFLLVPVGVYEDNTWEPLTDQILEWQSTNNTIFGGSAGELASSRSDPPEGDFSSFDFITATSVSFFELSDDVQELINGSGYVGPSLEVTPVPLPGALLALLTAISGFAYLARRRS